MGLPTMSVPTTKSDGSKHSLFRTYWFSIVFTLAIFATVGGFAGWAALFSVVVLTVLEITFSFDNAVVNSRLLVRMSPFWQFLFMTVGIFVAVFLVRFALPIFIVQLTADLGFVEVVQLALNNPAHYAEELHKAAPMIDAFGGTFLLMIGVAYFLDHEKDVHWIHWIEKRLAPLGRYDNITTFVMIAAALVMYFTVGGDGATRAMVLVAAIAGIALHIGLDLFGAIADGDEDDDQNEDETKPQNKGKVLVGVAAFVMFLRLEVLDASFSFDGVIGAFAITSSVLIIMAGLGAGALWVRSMTVHLVRAGTLAKFRYLEHGAMWAIAFLGGVMILKLYGIEPPEWATGSIGLVFIGLAVASSMAATRRERRLAA